MNLRTSPGPVVCSKCAGETGTGFKIQGQSGHVCATCLGDHAVQQGTNKTVTIDGIHKGGVSDNTALGPSGQGGKMN
jgi:hypothetical protein